MNSYHNTNSENGTILIASETKALKQEEIILNYFQKYPQMSFNPDFIWTNLFDIAIVPITSTKRSLTNLTERGLLVKTDKMSKSIFGKMIHEWMLRKPDNNQFNLFQ